METRYIENEEKLVIELNTQDVFELFLTTFDNNSLKEKMIDIISKHYNVSVKSINCKVVWDNGNPRKLVLECPAERK